jgi:hypothetical protein
MVRLNRQGRIATKYGQCRNITQGATAPPTESTMKLDSGGRPLGTRSCERSTPEGVSRLAPPTRIDDNGHRETAWTLQCGRQTLKKKHFLGRAHHIARRTRVLLTVHVVFTAFFRTSTSLTPALIVCHRFRLCSHYNPLK